MTTTTKTPAGEGGPITFQALLTTEAVSGD